MSSEEHQEGGNNGEASWRTEAGNVMAAGRAAHGLATRGSESRTKWAFILGGLVVTYVAGFTILGLALEHPLNGALTAVSLAPAVLLAYYYMHVRYASSLFDLGEVCKGFLKGMAVSVPAVLIEVGLLVFVMTYVFATPAEQASHAAAATPTPAASLAPVKGSATPKPHSMAVAVAMDLLVQVSAAAGSSSAAAGSGAGSAIHEATAASADESPAMYETQVIFAFFFAYFVAAIVGEGLKYATVSSATKLFREPYEVVVYGCAVAIGFATMEQALTVIFAGIDPRIPVQNRFVLGLVKGVLTVPMHTVCGLWTSVGISRRIFYYDHMPFLRVVLTPVVVHGTFTFTLVAFLHTRFEVLGLVLVAALNALAFATLHKYLLPSLGETVPPELII
jgi:RsiW-degrading membrane proteinase PrsW (M82 family)